MQLICIRLSCFNSIQVSSFSTARQRLYPTSIIGRMRMTTTTQSNIPKPIDAELVVGVRAIDGKRLSKLSNTKILHVCRHAQGAHNVNQEYRNIENLDARLTPEGYAQCENSTQRLLSEDLRYILNHPREDLLIVSSPLTRCLQTTQLSFAPLWETEKPQLSIVAHEDVRETVNYNCDRRRTIADIAREFNGNNTNVVEFSWIENNHDALWEKYEERLGAADVYTSHRESAELYRVAERGRRFLQWLSQRPESVVILCSHAAFLRCIWNYGQDGGVPRLMEQVLDDRKENTASPLFRYENEAVEEYMRNDFGNCELRSVILSFGS